jgi:hypothetical protein
MAVALSHVLPGFPAVRAVFSLFFQYQTPHSTLALALTVPHTYTSSPDTAIPVAEA